MLRLRPYKSSDGKYILKWFSNEEMFTKWSANKFLYPLTEQQLIDYEKKYSDDEFSWIMVAVDSTGRPVGHLLMRKADYINNSIHLGFIIVDSAQRGKGYGKEMLSLALKYAFEIINVSRVTLCVFENNKGAHQCYKSVGFVDEDYLEDTFKYKDEVWPMYKMAATK